MSRVWGDRTQLSRIGVSSFCTQWPWHCHLPVWWTSHPGKTCWYFLRFHSWKCCYKYDQQSPYWKMLTSFDFHLWCIFLKSIHFFTVVIFVNIMMYICIICIVFFRTLWKSKHAVICIICYCNLSGFSCRYQADNISYT